MASKNENTSSVTKFEQKSFGEPKQQAVRCQSIVYLLQRCFQGSRYSGPDVIHQLYFTVSSHL